MVVVVVVVPGVRVVVGGGFLATLEDAIGGSLSLSDTVSVAVGLRIRHFPPTGTG